MYFDLCGFETVYRTEDLHRELAEGRAAFRPNYISEHERKYMELGVPIKAGIFRMKAEAPGFDPTRYRLTPGVKKEALERLGYVPKAQDA